MPSARRSPTAMRSNAAGRITLTNVAVKESWSERANSSSRGSIARTAEAVMRSTGHTQAKATTEASIGTPKPKTSSASGISATEGMGRSASMVGPTTRSTRGERPMTTPLTMPSTAAIANPASAASKVSHVSRRIDPSAKACANASATAEGREKESSGRTPARLPASHSETTASGKASPRNPGFTGRSLVFQQPEKPVPVLEEACVLARLELASGPRNRHGDVLHDAAGVGAEHDHPVAEIDRLLQVMRDEDDRGALPRDQPPELVLQPLSRDRIQRTEGL